MPHTFAVYIIIVSSQRHSHISFFLLFVPIANLRTFPSPIIPVKTIISTMFKLAAFAALVGSAAAFAPAQTGRVATDLAVSELELGVTEPLGVYDPLGWLETEPEAFERRRAVERKHGRVAMAAVLGSIVHHNDIEFDGYLSPSANLKFSDIPNGVDGIRAIPTAGLAQILAFFALVELAWMPASKYDGDYGVGYFGTDIKDPEEKARKLNVELNNGRAAMMGILGIMVHDVLEGKPFIFIDMN